MKLKFYYSICFFGSVNIDCVSISIALVVEGDLNFGRSVGCIWEGYLERNFENSHPGSKIKVKIYSLLVR